MWFSSMSQRPQSGYCQPLSVLKMGNVYRMGRVLYETIWAWVGSVSSQILTRLICFHFSPLKSDGWPPSAAGWDQGSSEESAGSGLHSLPHGVHLPAVVVVKNESQVELYSIFHVEIQYIWHFEVSLWNSMLYQKDMGTLDTCGTTWKQAFICLTWTFGCYMLVFF